MAYTTVDKIKAMFRKIKIEDDTGTESTNTAITTEDVNQWITDADAEIDSKLSAYYVTPITGTESLKIVDVISKYKVAHVIKTVLEVQDQTSDKNQDVQTNLDKKADKMLNDLIPQYKNGKWLDPVARLTDAAKLDTSPISGSVFGRNYATSSPTRAPSIKKGGDNW